MFFVMFSHGDGRDYGHYPDQDACAKTVRRLNAAMLNLHHGLHPDHEFDEAEDAEWLARNGYEPQQRFGD